MDKNQYYHQFVNSEAYPMFKFIVKDMQSNLVTKMVSSTTSKDDLFILQKQYQILQGMEELIKASARIHEKGDVI